MTWNPAPEIAALRDFGKRFGADRAVIVYTKPSGEIGMASYGKTKVLCDRTKPIGNKLFEKAQELFAEDDSYADWPRNLR